MKILVIGSGGREHALAWKLAQSPRASRVFVAPGNAGTALEPGVVNVEETETDALIAFAQRERIALTIVGPEAPLAAGVVDAFTAAGLVIFGPSRAAAQLESSKDFAKAFMARHGIPTAAYRSFTDADDAHRFVDLRGAPIVIKADGLAAGKGVTVAATTDEAHAAIDAVLRERRFGHGADGSARAVIEDFVEGEEASFIVMADGRQVLALATSQDHKRLLDDDKGPNTGGMGAYSPAAVITPALLGRFLREIIVPTVYGMVEEGTPYTGFLYAGVMIDRMGNPQTLEFNCRLGDPETQPLLMRLKTDLVDLIENALRGTLDRIDTDWDRRTALGVVLAAAGYPERPRSGDTVTGLAQASDECRVFHAGTALEGDRVVTRGGRVLCVTALGDNVRLAHQRAYAAIEGIAFDGMQYRHDIGLRGVTPAAEQSARRG
jgi:phosphoribosylamine--glycine ligase